MRLDTLDFMERCFRRFESGIRPPAWIPQDTGGWICRYADPSIEQAIIQKLARVISGLHASHALLLLGHLQEQGVIHRTLDEFNEDVLYLALARTTGEVTPNHKRYLAAFYEELAPAKYDAQAKIVKPDAPTRKNIQGYIERTAGRGVPASSAGVALSKAYSGFVHGASQAVMDMCTGDPPTFQVRGLPGGDDRMTSHTADAWNYLYRSLMSFEVTAKAFGDATSVPIIGSRIDRLAEHMGMKPRRRK